MSFDAELLIHGFGRIFAHECGHALVATLKNIPYKGIAYERDNPRFCTLTVLPVHKEAYSDKHYLYLAAGVAAERIVGVNDSQEGGDDDKKYFKSIEAFEQTVQKAQELLSSRRATIEYIVSILKTKAKEINCKLDCLENFTCNGRRYAMLLSEQQLKGIIEKH
jgi:hypothetical protein